MSNTSSSKSGPEFLWGCGVCPASEWWSPQLGLGLPDSGKDGGVLELRRPGNGEGDSAERGEMHWLENGCFEDWGIRECHCMGTVWKRGAFGNVDISCEERKNNRGRFIIKRPDCQILWMTTFYVLEFGSRCLYLPENAGSAVIYRSVNYTTGLSGIRVCA